MRKGSVIVRIPNHIGIIPDGNRRWAVINSIAKENGYYSGLEPGIKLFRFCRNLGVKELTYYGFTTDNTKRPAVQRRAFTDACVKAVKKLSEEDAELLVIGNTESDMFPEELREYTIRRTFGKGGIKINFLVNYGYQWDLKGTGGDYGRVDLINSWDISKIDLIIRWGGRRRLSGFLPVQSAYADFFVLDELWPEFTEDHVLEALKWYSKQDITLGG